jgi:short-subunit dehydrogenase
MKKVLITGGTGGIGKAIADNLQTNYDIITVARSNADICGDLTDIKFRDFLVESIIPDIFINNAGRLYYDQYKMLDINGTSAVDLLYKFYDKMPCGSIINISSISHLRSPQPKEHLSKITYGIAKKHLREVSMALNNSKSKPLKVMCVSPAAVDTKMIRELFGYQPKDEDYTNYNWENSIAWMKPKELADIIRYLIELPEHIVIPEISIDNHYSKAIYW